MQQGNTISNSLFQIASAITTFSRAELGPEIEERRRKIRTTDEEYKERCAERVFWREDDIDFKDRNACIIQQLQAIRSQKCDLMK